MKALCCTTLFVVLLNLPFTIMAESEGVDTSNNSEESITNTLHNESILPENFTVERCSSYILANNVEYTKIATYSSLYGDYAKKRLVTMETNAYTVCSCVGLRISAKKATDSSEKVKVYTHDVLRNLAAPGSDFDDIISEEEYPDIERLQEVLSTQRDCGTI